MLCPRTFQPSPLTMSPFLDLHWPVRSLWPETRPLFFQLEQEMMRHIQEMRQNMEFMERLHHKIFEEIDQNTSLSSTGFFRPFNKDLCFRELGGVDGGSSSFALSLDAQDFLPTELSVKQVGRRLRVSGKTERKSGDKGSSSYRCEEFRQELDLPDGVDAEAVTCSLVGGQLQIQAPRERAMHDGKERVVPISLTKAPLAAAAAAVTDNNSSTSSQCTSPTETEKTAEEKH